MIYIIAKRDAKMNIFLLPITEEFELGRIRIASGRIELLHWSQHECCCLMCPSEDLGNLICEQTENFSAADHDTIRQHLGQPAKCKWQDVLNWQPLADVAVVNSGRLTKNCKARGEDRVVMLGRLHN